MTIDFLKPDNDGTEQTTHTPDNTKSASSVNNNIAFIRDIDDDEDIDGLTKSKQKNNNSKSDDKADDGSLDLLTLTKDIVNNTESSSAATHTKSSSDYFAQFKDLTEQGYINVDDLPEELLEDDESPVSADDIIKALKHNLPKRDEALYQKSQEDLIASLPSELQNAVKLASNGGDYKDLLKITEESSLIKNLDVTSEVDQEKIVRKYYSDTDLTPEEINAKIALYKDRDILFEEANVLKPKLDAKADALAQQVVDDQIKLNDVKQQLYNAATSRLGEIVTKGIGTLSFNKDEAKELVGTIMTEQEFDYGDFKSSKTGIEFMIDYHKYAKDGDPSRVIKAMMILNKDGKYDSKIESMFKAKVEKQFVNDHITNSTNKFKQLLNKDDVLKTSDNNKKQKRFGN